METGEAIEQLEDLKAHCNSMCTGEPDEAWPKDVQALDHAIEVLKKKDLSSGN
ncbi:hypothetical protein [Proteiniborus sp.]|uniref:hypothetical protein n=1 Tax=Proteiniborus sp. TaxID=2079015 RepID=UPI00332A37E0